MKNMMSFARSYGKKGQVALEMQIGLFIVLTFVVVLLAAENESFPKLLQKQVNEHDRVVNIYRCYALDSYALLKVSLPAPKRSTNGTCIVDMEQLGGGQLDIGKRFVNNMKFG